MGRGQTQALHDRSGTVPCQVPGNGYEITRRQCKEFQERRQADGSERSRHILHNYCGRCDYGLEWKEAAPQKLAAAYPPAPSGRQSKLETYHEVQARMIGLVEGGLSHTKTAEKLAEEFGDRAVSQGTISAWFREHGSDPHPDPLPEGEGAAESSAHTKPRAWRPRGDERKRQVSPRDDPEVLERMIELARGGMRFREIERALKAEFGEARVPGYTAIHKWCREALFAERTTKRAPIGAEELTAEAAENAEALWGRVSNPPESGSGSSPGRRSKNG